MLMPCSNCRESPRFFRQQPIIGLRAQHGTAWHGRPGKLKGFAGAKSVSRLEVIDCFCKEFPHKSIQTIEMTRESTSYKLVCNYYSFICTLDVNIPADRVPVHKIEKTSRRHSAILFSCFKMRSQNEPFRTENFNLSVVLCCKMMPFHFHLFGYAVWSEVLQSFASFGQKVIRIHFPSPMGTYDI